MTAVALHRGSSHLWISNEHSSAEDLLALLGDLDCLLRLPACEVIKDYPKITVARVPLEISDFNAVYLKRYNAFSWRRRLGALFFRSGALRSWRGAAILEQSGFRTAPPIAAVECRFWGLVRKSFYLSAELKHGLRVDAYWRERLASLNGREGFRARRDFLQRLALLFRALHASNIYHNDLKDANILAASGEDGGQSFYLQDLEGIRRYRKLKQKRRVKNLTQLNRTMGRSLRGMEKFYFLKVYLGDSFSDAAKKREWIRLVLRMTRRADRRSRRKRSRSRF